MVDILDVYSPISYDESVSHYEIHSYIPYNTSRFDNNDEIRITIQHQELNVLPSESSLHIIGKLCLKNDETKIPENTRLVNNAICQLFEQIRYELNSVEIDRCKRVGLTSIMKGWVSHKPQKEECLINSGWLDVAENKTYTSKGIFDVNIPLKMLFGFAEDYKKIIINCRHELVLTRAHSDDNAVLYQGDAAEAEDVKVKIDKIEWLMPHVQLSNEYKIRMLRHLERQKPIKMAFRSWELYEYPVLPAANSHVWNVKTSSQLEKPRFAIIGLQTNRNNNKKTNASQFDRCNLSNVKVFLNDKYYPYANLHLDISGNQYSLLYDMFCKFQQSYYGGESEPAVSRAHYISYVPLIVIDCSKQNESLKNAPVDVKVELQSKENFPPNTAAHCLLLHDRVIEYNPITGDVRVAVA